MKFLFSVLIFILSVKAHAASCCGAGSALPSLITSDDKAIFTGSYSIGQIKTDVLANSEWQDRKQTEDSQGFKIEGAHIFQDRWQAGAMLPVITKKRGAETSQGLGDIVVTGGYESIPDWSYNPWRPHGVNFVSLTLPTGKSVYESEEEGLDARGRGFWALGTGMILTKSLEAWDLSASFEIHKAFDKKISNSSFDGKLKPGWGENLSLGVGYNIKNWRLGSSVTWTYEDAIQTEGLVHSQGEKQRFATTQFSINYLQERIWSYTLAYADQTLVGEPLNTSLNQTLSFLVQRKWSR